VSVEVSSIKRDLAFTRNFPYALVVLTTGVLMGAATVTLDAGGADTYTQPEVTGCFDAETAAGLGVRVDSAGGF
jgi:hypothetical protein